MEVDAIVNTTNEALTERTGCSGSIMFAGGPELATACVHSDPCRTGEAVITVAGRLAAKYVQSPRHLRAPVATNTQQSIHVVPPSLRHVIHTVGPKYNEKYKTAAENALHNCYRNCLRVLKENDLSTIAFPCVYTTKKGYPREAAAHIAIRTLLACCCCCCSSLGACSHTHSSVCMCPLPPNPSRLCAPFLGELWGLGRPCRPVRRQR